MKIIFSRKGVDSAAGRCASALVDGRPISLPIPTSMPTATRYCDLAAPIPAIARDLTRGRLAADQLCHLDPDVDRECFGDNKANGLARRVGPSGSRPFPLTQRRCGTRGRVSVLGIVSNMRVRPRPAGTTWDRDDTLYSGGYRSKTSSILALMGPCSGTIPVGSRDTPTSGPAGQAAMRFLSRRKPSPSAMALSQALGS